MKKIIKLLFSLMLVFNILSVVSINAQEEIDFILDWVPNTNHTGIFVALDNGYFEEEGLTVNVQRPPQGSVSELIGLGQAPFGIDFQDYLAAPLQEGLPVTAVAAIIEHNTSGIISRAEAEIAVPGDIAGKRYGTANFPIDLAMLAHLLGTADYSLEDVELVPNQGDNSVVALANEQFDAVQVYYAWDGIMAEALDINTNFLAYIDFAEELDFYSPIIIANNDYLANNPEQATRVLTAIKRGYQFAIDNPEEAADILISYAPELESSREVVIESQQWLSERYTSDPENWGYIEETRWNNFYHWMYENDLTDIDLSQENYFSNDYLGD